MLEIMIPGYKLLKLEVLVLDYNGTIAFDGKLRTEVKESVALLSQYLELHVLTADTFNTVVQQCHELPLRVKVLETPDHTTEKGDYLAQFGSRHVVAVGNGSNDRLLLEKATIGIAVLGDEGCSGKVLQVADVVVSDISAALGLLLHPQRLIATLRR